MEQNIVKKSRQSKVLWGNLTKICKWCGKEFTKVYKFSQKQWGKAEYCCKSCSNKSKKWTKENRDKVSGENSHSWKGGLTQLDKLIRNSFEYRQWRSDIFTRDNFTCCFCGVKGGRINADHIKALSLILKENNIWTLEEALKCRELWNINNGRTLCEWCHWETENYGSKSIIRIKWNKV